MLLYELFVSYFLLGVILLSGICKANPNYIESPTHELLKSEAYISVTKNNEFVVTHISGTGLNLMPDDYILRTDKKRMLSGSLQQFMESSEKEAVVPVVDNEDEKNGGFRLLGFVIVRQYLPRSIHFRRGEIGPFSAIETTTVSMVQGGGPCITSRDCFNATAGSCVQGSCQCLSRTGAYCQSPPAPSSDTTHRSDAQNSKLSTQEQDKTQETPKITLSRKTVKHPVDLAAHRTAAGIHEERKPETTSAVNINLGTTTTDSNVQKQSLAVEVDGSKDIITDSSTTTATIIKSPPPPPKPIVIDGKIVDFISPEFPLPEPYMAGQVPREQVTARSSNRNQKSGFIYAVRFRSGPIGISFDNKLTDATKVERVIAGLQAQQSDIQPGDHLIAIDLFNITNLPAKTTQKLMSGLSWPRVLVFQVQAMESAEDQKQRELLKIKQREVNITVLYPPALTGTYSVLLASWTPILKNLSDKRICPIYSIQSANDTFGCSTEEIQYRTPSMLSDMINNNVLAVDNSDVQDKYPMAYLLAQAAASGDITIQTKSIAIAKRGICTFVDKVKKMVTGGADFGLVINTENVLLDMPAGKENTSQCTIPTGSINEISGSMIYMTSSVSEVWAVLSSDTSTERGLSEACRVVMNKSTDLLDRWPYSVPKLAPREILRSPPLDTTQVRKLADIGGRVAISGENGWAFFDYHLAMFGPQDVPIGPHRLQMALPPYGCDPAAYEVRITGTIVAILRGGGCSFGIKVINAQKLGAKAVMIVNTEDKSSIRLRAMPDEEPLVHIPCIMVGRRVQYYLEGMLKYFYLIDQHIISIQPMTLLGQYDSRNEYKLPEKAAL